MTTNYSRPADPQDVLADMDGRGTADAPYVVTTVVELQAIEGDLDAHYELGCDIDASPTRKWDGTKKQGFVTEFLTAITIADPEPDSEPEGEGFRPIGECNDGDFLGFRGTFDGNGHEIVGLYSNYPIRGVGLFRCLSDGTVCNVSMRNVVVEGNLGVGAVAGVNQGGSIKNVTVDGEIRGDSAGGIVGGGDGEIRDSTAACTVEGDDLLGGIAGENYGDIRNCASDGSVSGDVTVGGLVGKNTGTITHCSVPDGISSMQATGDDTAGSLPDQKRPDIETTVSGIEYVGGIVGSSSNGAVRDVVFSGTVRGDWSVGGIAGQSNGEIAKSTAYGTIHGKEHIGGIVGLNLVDAVVANATAVCTVDGTNEVGGVIGVHLGSASELSFYGDVTGDTDGGKRIGSEQAGDSDHTSDAESIMLDTQPDRTFDDIGGMEQLIDKLDRQVIDPLQHPDKYDEYGLGTVGGVLLYGPPGCGKTYIAGALAGEANYNFVEITPTEITSKYIGEAADNVAEVFETARENQPCVLFIDEIDAIARDRTDQSNTSEQQMVNQLLTELDEISKTDVVVVAATNYLADIDDAILRSGRFDERIEVPPPDAAARREIIELHLADRPTVDDLEFEPIVAATAGYAASDIELITDLAARYALEDGAPIGASHLTQAVEETETSLHGWLERYDWLRPGEDGVVDLSLDEQSPSESADDLPSKPKDTAGARSPGSPTETPSGDSRAENETGHRSLESFETLRGFTDVTAKLESRVVDPVQSPETYSSQGVKPPSGVLLYGPSGTGKTTLAHAIAGELERPLFELSPEQILQASNEHARLAEIIAAAQNAQPSVLCLDRFDELHAVTETERIQTLLAALADITEDDVLVVVTVTETDDLPESMLYAEWLDEKIEIGRPDAGVRRAILEAELPDAYTGPSIDWERVLDATEGFVIRDLTRVANTAARNAISSATEIETEHLVSAADSVRGVIDI